MSTPTPTTVLRHQLAKVNVSQESEIESMIKSNTAKVPLALCYLCKKDVTAEHEYTTLSNSTGTKYLHRECYNNNINRCKECQKPIIVSGPVTFMSATGQLTCRSCLDARNQAAALK